MNYSARFGYAYVFVPYRSNFFRLQPELFVIKTGGPSWTDHTTDVPTNHIILGEVEGGYMFDINVCLELFSKKNIAKFRLAHLSF